MIVQSPSERQAVRRALVLLMLLSAIVGVAGCTTSHAQGSTYTADEVTIPVIATDSSSQLPTTVTDASGASVTVIDTSRIIVLNGGIAETIVSMGLRDRIIGRDVSTDFAGIKDVPLVTQGHDVSAEGLLALNPTLVIGDARSGPPEALSAVRQARVPVVIVPEVWALNEAPIRVTAIAAALGMPTAGRQVNTYLADSLNGIRNTIEATNQQKPTVAFLYVRGSAAVYLLGGEGSGADDMIEAAGGTDAGTRANLESFTPLTPEALVNTAPDVILVMDKGLESVGGVAGLTALPGVAQTPAGRNGKVVSLPDGELLSFGPRSADTVKRLAELIR